MKSGMLAAEAAAAELAKEPTAAGRALDLGAYETAMHDSWVHTELHRERNIRPSFGLGAGIWGGLLGSALEAYVLRGKAPWTLRHRWGRLLCFLPATCKSVGGRRSLIPCP